jgi:hypothetical protein
MSLEVSEVPKTKAEFKLEGAIGRELVSISLSSATCMRRLV